MVESQYTLVDTPANYHNNGSIISFADCHVEHHRWLEPTTTPLLIRGAHLSGVPIYTSKTDRDLKWLTERTTVKKWE